MPSISGAGDKAENRVIFPPFLLSKMEIKVQRKTHEMLILINTEKRILGRA